MDEEEKWKEQGRQEIRDRLKYEISRDKSSIINKDDIRLIITDGK